MSENQAEDIKTEAANNAAGWLCKCSGHAKRLEFDQKIDRLAANGNHSPAISLFHRGLEILRWLMKVAEKMGLSF